jgi:hypothetical protein
LSYCVSVWLWSLVFPCYSPILPFGNEKVYSVLLYLGSVQIDFTGAHSSEFVLSLRKDFKFRPLNNVEIVKTLGILGNGLNAF